MQQYHTLVLEDLATSTQADRKSVPLLTKTISELSTQVATLSAKLATAQSENAWLEKLGHRSILAEHSHRASRNSTLSDPNSNQDHNVYSKSRQKFDPNGYCSYHGYKVEEAHTSETFCFSNNGYNKLATRMDIKGFQTWNKECINGELT